MIFVVKYDRAEIVDLGLGCAHRVDFLLRALGDDLGGSREARLLVFFAQKITKESKLF